MVNYLEFYYLFTDAISEVDGAGSIANVLTALPPVPRAFPVYPFALTNPIYIDADSDGEFEPPGIQSWLVAPEETEE